MARCLSGILILFALVPHVISAQTLPAGFYLEDVAPGVTFDLPVATEVSPDGRIFVVEKSGVVWIVDNGVVSATPFIDLSAEVMDHHDRGLLGFTLDPDFDTNGHAYFLYTVDHDGSGDYSRTDVFGRLTRYTASAGDPDVADLSTRTVLIGATWAEGIPACYFSHAPGSLRFGTDGSLLVSAGDGGSYNEVDAGGLYSDCFGTGRFDSSEDIGAFRSQYINSLAGKILRIDPSTGLGYPSNPFYTGNPADNASRVWMKGLRNPFRFSIRNDGALTTGAGDPGTLYIGDVGWGTWEEINVGNGAENWGWPCHEGPNPHGGYQSASPSHSDCSTVGAVDDPSTYYHHNNTNNSFPTGLGGNSIVGGPFYEGTKYPIMYQNKVWYGDYARGWMVFAEYDVSNNFVSQTTFSTDLGPVVDIHSDGNHLYFVNIGDGKVYRLRHSDEDDTPPVAIAAATPNNGPAPLEVQFTGSGSFDPDSPLPLNFVWDFGTGDSAFVADPVYTFNSAGTYNVTMSVTNQSGLTSTYPLVIYSGNTFPSGTIVSPSNGEQFDAFSVVDLVASGSDPEDPEVSLSYAWEVTQIHNAHDHPDFFTAAGKTASFQPGYHGLQYEVFYLRVDLLVTDTGGLTDTTTHYVVVTRDAEQDITPDGTPVALVTAPTGSGNPDIGVIKDGIVPLAGISGPEYQYDTNTGPGHRSDDWVGYTFDDNRHFSRAQFTEGIHFGGAVGDEFDYPDFSDVSAFTLNGEAVQSGSVLRLVPNINNLAGSAFLTTPVTLFDDSSFEMFMQFRMHSGNSADGMAFVMQDVGPSFLGISGGGIGYFDGGGASFMVELDIWNNGSGGNMDDNNDNHVAVFTSETKLAEYLPSYNLDDGNSHGLWLDYDGDNDLLRVFVSNDPGVKPATPAMTVDVDLSAVLGSQAYVGFTAATGGLNEHHDVEAWSFKMGDPDFLAGTGAGGWFESIGLEIRNAGVWTPVNYLSVLKPYESNNGADFETYQMVFESAWGDGIRVRGVPGGSNDFISVAEFRVYESPDHAPTGAPTVVTFSPTSGPEGTLVTLTGANYVDVASVTLDGSPVPFNIISASYIEVEVPAGASSGIFQVNTPLGSGTSLSAFTVTIPTGSKASLAWGLRQNYPNPFNPSTTIEFALSSQSQTRVVIYDVTGRKVKTLVSSVLPAGVHTSLWTGVDDRGTTVGSGVYFVVLEANGLREARKLVLQK